MPSRAETLMQRIEEKARRGHRGDPVGTIALYGPDDRLASKLVVGFSPSAALGITETQKFWSEGDVRRDAAVLERVWNFIAERGVKSLVMTGGVYGCPHEEGIDYPQGESCPQCPFWKGRARDVPLIG